MRLRIAPGPRRSPTRAAPCTASQNPIIVSAGWDKVVKVWNLTNCKLRNNLAGHQGYVNTVTVSPDGSLCASGGKVRWGAEAGGLGRAGVGRRGVGGVSLVGAGGVPRKLAG